MPKKIYKKAVALKYDREKDDSPRVAAKGQGRVAEKILELAKKHDIPIKDDPVVIVVLSSREIP
jgi:flagellar biosynthesis protein